MNARAQAVAELESRLGHAFSDRELLERALTHSSVGEGARSVRDNERLEFLGDRVLGLIVAERLAETLPDAREGELSRRLHVLVSRDACAAVARRLGVGPALRLAPGESKSGGRDNATILGDACEAIIAAVYLDAGYATVRRLVRDWWEPELHRLSAPREHDPKSALQEWAQGRGRPLPAYAVVERTGPDHAPAFVVEVRVEGVSPAVAKGRSRQEAEKAAAAIMLKREGV